MKSLFWSLVYFFHYPFQRLDYHGRATRLEFWIFQLLYAGVLVLLMITNGISFWLSLILAVVVMPAIAANHIKRVHDVEYSGFFLLPKLFYVPWWLWVARQIVIGQKYFDGVVFSDDGLVNVMMVGLFYGSLVYELILLIIYCQAGTVGRNIYGDDSCDNFYKNRADYVARLLERF